MIAERSYDLAPFDSIDIATGIHAIVTVGTAQSIRVEASRKRLLDRLILEIVDGQLRAQHNGDLLDALLSGSLFNFSKLGRAATMHISVPALSGVQGATGAQIEVGTLTGSTIEIGVSTAAHVEIASSRAETVAVTASSSGTAELSGACETLSVKASSGARINAVELSSTNFAVEASSGSAVEATATTRASGQVGSGAAVCVFGRPQVMEIKSVGGGTLSVN